MQVIEPDVSEMTLTASFVLTVGAMVWLKEETKRRGLKSVSELLRLLLDDARAAAEQAA